MQPGGDIGPTPYAGYRPAAGKTAKGYFVNGPVNMIAGTASAIYNYEKTIQGIGNAVAHRITTATAVGDALAKKLDSSEGQGEVGFAMATILVAPEASAEVTVPTTTVGTVATLAQTT